VGVGGVALVAVVVDDGDLEVGEALARPSGREPPQAGRWDVVLGVGGDDVVLMGACPAPKPRCVISFGGPAYVHGLVPDVAVVGGEPMLVLAGGERFLFHALVCME